MPKQLDPTVPRDEALTIFVMGVLWHAARGTVPLWVPANTLFEKAAVILPKGGFEDAGHFRAFMGELVDRDLVVEMNGRTRTEPDLKLLKFRLSRWFYTLLIRTAEGKV